METENLTAPETSPSDAIADSVAPATVSEPTMPEPSRQEPPPSYVKLAMRNMVRKRGTSLFHFFLTTTGLLALFVGLAYLTR